MASELNTQPKPPLIVVMGSTGTGKSNLGIEIARHLEPAGEIVNCDAMQLYRGLPIITNKIKPNEQRGIRHHLLDIIDLEQEPWTVTQFVKNAENVIEDIRTRGKIPILVGGTGYYVHGLTLGSNLVAEHRSDNGGTRVESAINGTSVLAQDWDTTLSTPELYAKLQEIDPDMAKRWHPNDRRKIQRSLEIWNTTGQKASVIYADQQQEHEKGDTIEDERESLHISCSSGGASHAKYDLLIFWLDAQDAILKARLDERVDGMLDAGLLDEARELFYYRMQEHSHGRPVDLSKGIWVSIGYKELEPYLSYISSNQREEHHRSESLSSAANSLLRECIESVKAGTRRYAKIQNRYIRIRLAQALDNAGFWNRLFLLDTTNTNDFENSVVSPALQLVKIHLQGGVLPDPASMSTMAQQTFAKMAQARTTVAAREARRCEICDKVLMTVTEYDRHMSSRGHKKVVEAIRRRERNERARSEREETDVTIDSEV